MNSATGSGYWLLDVIKYGRQLWDRRPCVPGCSSWYRNKHWLLASCTNRVVWLRYKPLIELGVFATFNCKLLRHFCKLISGFEDICTLKCIFKSNIISSKYNFHPLLPLCQNPSSLPELADRTKLAPPAITLTTLVSGASQPAE